MKHGHLVSAAALPVVIACASTPSPALGPHQPREPAAAVSEPASPRWTPSVEWTFDDPGRRGRALASTAVLDEPLTETREKQGLPGIAFGLVLDGELLYARGYGHRTLDRERPPDVDTRYRIGSITKSFTALAVLALRDRGSVRLDDPLVRHLPEAQGLVYPTRDSPPLTIRHLLQHRSGLPRLGRFVYWKPELPPPTESVILRSLQGLPVQAPPGDRFQYSNLGYSLLGLAAARASGSTYRQLVATRLLQPLGIDPFWDEADVPAAQLAPAFQKRGDAFVPISAWRLGASEAAGGLYASVGDMARYIAFQLDAYPPRDTPDDGPVRRSTRREAHNLALASARPRAFVRREERSVRLSAPAYAFCWNVSGTCEFERLVSHHGGTEGYSSYVAFLPHYGVGAVALTNANGADLGAPVNRALRALVEHAALKPRRQIRAPVRFAKAVERLLGVYHHWDPKALGAVLARKPLAGERDELAAYHADHGACGSFRLQEVIDHSTASFALQCERGDFELRLTLDAGTNRILGFHGVSRGLEPPSEVVGVADRLLALQRRWRRAEFTRAFAPGTDERLFAQGFASWYAESGACRRLAYHKRWRRHEFELACDRSGPHFLEFELDDEARVTRLIHRPGPPSPCPPL